MRGAIYAVLALSAAVNAQSAARDEYKAICDLPETGKTYSDGYEIEYTCKAVGDVFDEIDSKTLDTPDECAQLCKTTPGCKASAWAYATLRCTTYNSEAIGDEVSGVVHMRVVSPDTTPPPTDDGSDDLKKCKNDLAGCQADKDDLNDELDKCLKGRAEDKKACEDKIKALEDSVRKCEADLKKCEPVDPVWERRKEAMKICGYGGRKTIKAGAYEWRAFCNRQTSTGTFYRQLAVSVDDCVAACSADSKCKAVSWVIMNDAHCKMYTNGEVNKAKDVFDEATCPRHFMISFAPTTKK